MHAKVRGQLRTRFSEQSFRVDIGHYALKSTSTVPSPELSTIRMLTTVSEESKHVRQKLLPDTSFHDIMNVIRVKFSWVESFTILQPPSKHSKSVHGTTSLGHVTDEGEFEMLRNELFECYSDYRSNPTVLLIVPRPDQVLLTSEGLEILSHSPRTPLILGKNVTQRSSSNNGTTPEIGMSSTPFSARLIIEIYQKGKLIQTSQFPILMNNPLTFAGITSDIESAFPFALSNPFKIYCEKPTKSLAKNAGFCQVSSESSLTCALETFAGVTPCCLGGMTLYISTLVDFEKVSASKGVRDRAMECLCTTPDQRKKFVILLESDQAENAREEQGVALKAITAFVDSKGVAMTSAARCVCDLEAV